MKVSENPKRESGKKISIRCSLAAKVIENYQNLVKIIFDGKADMRTYPSWSANVVIQSFRKACAESLKLDGIIRSTKAQNLTVSRLMKNLSVRWRPYIMEKGHLVPCTHICAVVPVTSAPSFHT